MHNERVKVLADVKEALEKHGCVLPDSAALGILNDKSNEKVFGTNPNGNDPYTKVPWGDVDALIDEREKARKELGIQ
jgi:hypothetical protein